MFSLVYGSQTEEANSGDGRTRDLYACSLTVVELMLMFLRRKPSVLFAFVVMLFIYHNICNLLYSIGENLWYFLFFI
jgi:hypothetical protein